jgi:hypothetical protein
MVSRSERRPEIDVQTLLHSHVQAEPAMGPGAAACQYFTRKRTGSGARMRIRVGFEMIYDFPQPTPVIMVIGTHFTRASDIIVPDHLCTSPSVPITPYRDGFGNWCSRFVAPADRCRAPSRSS